MASGMFSVTSHNSRSTGGRAETESLYNIVALLSVINAPAGAARGINGVAGWFTAGETVSGRGGTESTCAVEGIAMAKPEIINSRNLNKLRVVDCGAK